MRVRVIENAGFCFGVQRATKLAFETAATTQGHVFTLGPLIHNPQVVQKLKDEGVEVVTDLNGVEEGTLIVRSHGLHPTILKEAKAKGFRIVDATCPFVKKAQSYAALLKKEGYQVVVVGDRQHPEVQGIEGYSGGNILVVACPEEVKKLHLKTKIGVVAQTTQSLSNFIEIVDELLKSARELKIFNTICGATMVRQKATMDLSRQVDLMLIVGGRNSANTTRLAKICSDADTPTYLLETADEIQPEWLKDKKEIGVSAGASTPNWIITEVVQKLESLAA
ncbi:MAG: 4-hydroxy-3-methylbut-2-enyl diphosphate reductase [Candidatus Schekmanbacteria bacterium]|nr:4-hydroxy-3-methylbut-2-enyl diphosphate reductase [Candidatus Schekmanbacteria bacterium]